MHIHGLDAGHDAEANQSIPHQNPLCYDFTQRPKPTFPRQPIPIPPVGSPIIRTLHKNIHTGGPMNREKLAANRSHRAPSRNRASRMLSSLLLIPAAALLSPSMPLQAQVPVAQLAKPPANAQAFTVLSTSGTNGNSYIWTAPDGSRMSRESILLRGQVWEIDQKVILGPDAMPSSLIVRGVTPQGDAAETFNIAAAKASWKSPVDTGSSPYTSPAFYNAQGGTAGGGTQLLLEALLAAPDKSLALLPGGRAHLEHLTELTIGQGTLKKTVTAWAILGLSPSPQPVWATAEGKFFGFVGGLAAPRSSNPCLRPPPAPSPSPTSAPSLTAPTSPPTKPSLSTRASSLPPAPPPPRPHPPTPKSSTAPAKPWSPAFGIRTSTSATTPPAPSCSPSASPLFATPATTTS
jgi:hypothetical protein